MKNTKYDRHQILLFTAVAILFLVVSIGCSQNNESKIVGNWKSQHIDDTDGTVQYVLFNFYKQGSVTIKTGIITDDQPYKQKYKNIGKYKFEDDNKNISIAWEDGNSEKMNVSFPQNNKMLLGKYEMEKIK